MADKNSGTFMGGVILGAAIGAVAGLLTAPRKGRDTRKIIHKTATAIPEIAADISSSVTIQVDRLTNTAQERWHDTLDRLSEAITAGIVASQELHQSETSTTPQPKAKAFDRPD